MSSLLNTRGRRPPPGITGDHSPLCPVQVLDHLGDWHDSPSFEILGLVPFGMKQRIEKIYIFLMLSNSIDTIVCIFFDFFQDQL